MRDRLAVQTRDEPLNTTPAVLLNQIAAQSSVHIPPSPFDHQPLWVSAQDGQAFILPLPRGHETEASSLAVHVRDSRILFGHHFLRVARFGHGWNSKGWEKAIQTLAAHASGDRRVLRLNLELFLRSGMPKMRQILTRHGFTPVSPRSYRHTLTLPIDTDDETILATRKSLRKRLREAEKSGVAVMPLTNTRYADRITELQRMAMQRSGGHFHTPDWNTVLRFSADHPELSCVVGMFCSVGRTDPSDLLGFAWGCMHGDHAEYRAAGTAEVPAGLRNLSVSHPLLWHLIRWSRSNGATWFDMGGVTLQTGSNDPLAGISAVKRVFSETVEEVGEEWMLEPHPWKSRTSRTLSTIAGMLSRLRSR